MKIIFCDNSLKELLNFRGDIIRNFLDQGHEAILVAPENVPMDIIHENVKLIPIKIERAGMNPISDWKYFKDLFLIYIKVKPSYIFHYTIKPNIYGSIAAKLLKIPSTAMIAGLGFVFGSNELKAKIGRFLYKFALKFPEHILLLNRNNYDLIIEKGIAPKSKLILLKGGEGVNLEKFE